MSVIAPVLPVLIPLGTAVATAMTLRSPTLQLRLAMAGSVALLATGLWLVAVEGTIPPEGLGGWAVPFGIAFHLDGVGALMVLVTALMAVASLLYMSSGIDTDPRHPLLVPVLMGMVAGVTGAFSTADLFNLYVWFEIMLITALGVLAMGGTPRHLDATWKYLGLNLFGTLLLLAAVGLIYGATGHLNYDALASAAPGVPPGLMTALLVVLGVSLLLKSGAFPLFAWLPASYHTLPAPVLALVAGLLTKVGVYALLRLGNDVFAGVAAPVLFEALGWVAAATMLLGVIGAAYHWDMRRILAFHIISQIGYILLAIALGGLGDRDASAAAVFYTLHHIVVKANLFLIAGLIAAYAGSYDLRRIGGVHAAMPMLSVLFAIPALSLVGIPPLSGFWAKVLVLQSLVEQGRWVWLVFALGVSVLTLYSMMKIWLEAMWRPHPQAGWQRRAVRAGPALAAACMLAGVTLWIGLAPQTLIDLSLAAVADFGPGVQVADGQGGRP
jgi:multicomponent Na+:H+ antiporter subunit D